MSTDKQEKVVMRHILEVRLKNKLFSFLDNKGKMMDSLAKVFKTDQFKLTQDGGRFDLATTDLSKVFFFSVENFGFQIDVSENHIEFREQVKDFCDKLMNTGYYSLSNGLSRVGTKSEILFHRKGDSLESLKLLFEKRLFKSADEIKEFTKSEITDTAYYFDSKVNSGHSNVMIGPVTKKEVISKFFSDRAGLYDKNYNPSNGVYLSVDVANREEINIESWSKLSEKIDSQISDIESQYEGLRKFLYVKTD